MRIALISSEFSGLPGSGGIGTYFLELASCLVAAGQEVEVFTSGKEGDLAGIPGVRFHHLGSHQSPGFAFLAARALEKRHAEAPFDVIEGAELNAEGILAAKAVREAAFVVRLHSPSVMLDRYLDLAPTFSQRVKGVFWQLVVTVGALRRGIPLKPIRLEPFTFPWVPPADIEERNTAATADLVIVMNREMRDFAKYYWWIKEEVIHQVPNPLRLQPSKGVLPSNKSDPPTIGFLGRLEPRKGIIELAQALRRVLPDYPEWRVQIAGRSMPSCLSGSDSGEIAKSILKPFADQVDFIGPVAPENVPVWLTKIDICVFPSLWETFSYVVLEAAAAGRAIIATETGAIPEILDHGRVGEIVPPGHVKRLEESLRKLMGNPQLRARLEIEVESHARNHFHHDRITKKILETYRLAIAKRDQRLA